MYTPKDFKRTCDEIIAGMRQGTIGYHHVKKMILLCLTVNGNSLITGPPGLGKTTLMKVIMLLIKGIQTARIQFTPDVKASDVMGGAIWHPGERRFEIEWGPAVEWDGNDVNILLGDEINRCPPKTGAALLELGQEKKCTIMKKERKMEDLYVICGTRNPIETEGTYSMSEALLDRFLVELFMLYESRANEYELLTRMMKGQLSLKNIQPVTSLKELMEMGKTVLKLAEQISDAVRLYAIDVVRATRPEDPLFDQVHGKDSERLKKQITSGGSVRAQYGICYLAAANALADGRDEVSIDDIKFVAPDVLRHRIILNPAAGRGVKIDEHIIKPLLEKVQFPAVLPEVG